MDETMFQVNLRAVLDATKEETAWYVTAGSDIPDDDTSSLRMRAICRATRYSDWTVLGKSEPQFLSISYDWKTSQYSPIAQLWNQFPGLEPCTVFKYFCGLHGAQPESKHTTGSYRPRAIMRALILQLNGTKHFYGNPVPWDDHEILKKTSVELMAFVLRSQLWQYQGRPIAFVIDGISHFTRNPHFYHEASTVLKELFKIFIEFHQHKLLFLDAEGIRMAYELATRKKFEDHHINVNDMK